MIDPKELHIGCWYNLKNTMSGVLEPAQFDNWTAALDFEAYGEGIPINSEWLTKISTQTKRDIWEVGRLRIWLGNGCICYLIDEDSGDGHYLPNGDIKYIHQIQALYLSLMGKELSIRSFNQSN